MKKERIIAIVVLLTGWQIASILINNDMIFPSVIQIFKIMASQFFSKEFYIILFTTLLRLIQGLMMSLLLSILILLIEEKWGFFQDFFGTIISLIRSIPTVSFIVISLIWFHQEGSVRFIAFMVLFPIFHSSLSIGIKQFKHKTDELLRIYPVKESYRLFYLVFPMMLPYFFNSLKLAFGMGFKVSVMAEIMASIRIGIGREMKIAQNNLLISEIFAWSGWILIICLLIDIFFDYLIKKTDHS